MAGNPQTIHLNDDGSPYIPQQDVIHLDDSGNEVGRNGILNLKNQTFQSPPPGQGPDIQNVVPSGNQIGTTVAGALPALGATAASETGPLGMALGAAGGSQAANILKSYFPKTFSENQQPPSMLDQLSSDATAAATERGNQIISAAAPEVGRLGMTGLSKVPSIAKGIKYQSDLDAYNGEVERNIQAGIDAKTSKDMAIAKLKSFAQKDSTAGVGIDEPKAVQEILGKTINVKDSVNVDKLNSMLDDPAYRGIISDGTKANMKAIGKAAQDADEALASIPDAGKAPKAPVYRQGGKYFLRYGAPTMIGGAAGSMIGMSHEGVMAGAGVGGLIQLGQSQLAKIAQDPVKTRALVKLMSPDTTSGEAKLISNGLLRGLRGEEVMMNDEKVKINDQGVPQIQRE